MEHEIKSNEIHRMIAENLTDLVSIINRNGVIQYVNPSFKTVLNYDLPLLQKSNFFEKIHQDEQDTVRNEIIILFWQNDKKGIEKRIPTPSCRRILYGCRGRYC